MNPLGVRIIVRNCSPLLAGSLLYLACSSEPGSPSPVKDSRQIAPPSAAPNVRFADLSVEALKEYGVTLNTSLGDIKIELLPQQAPETVRQELSRKFGCHIFDSAVSPKNLLTL